MRVGKRSEWSCVLLAFVLTAPMSPVWGQEPEQPEEAAVEEEGGGMRPRLDFGLEAKAHYRDSDLNRFPVRFPFTPAMLPVGQTQGFEETVNAGSHFEVSTVTLFVNASWGESLTGRVKIDFIDLYDRNPTSSDRAVDVDEAWVRFGREPEPATLADHSGLYLKVGKIPKLERQDDRHLESYGLVSTAFNRFEDAGAELGAHLGRHFYFKLSATAGNPVFLRDPNALAGDNGTDDLARFPNPDPELKTGVVILYDAEVEDLDVDGDLELGGGLGVRFADEAGRNGLDLLAWGFERTLADTVELEGTFYGGDLDLLDGPGGLAPLPVTDDKKREVGGNVWLYLDGFSFFGQYVDQEIGGLPRTGIEGEIAWRFDLPLVWAVDGRQLFTFIAPAVRYSKLDNDFEFLPVAGRVPSPAPSLTWDWEKIDAGLRLGIFSGVDLTVEYADNRFILGSGAERENNEFLSTLRWRI